MEKIDHQQKVAIVLVGLPARGKVKNNSNINLEFFRRILPRKLSVILIGWILKPSASS